MRLLSGNEAVALGALRAGVAAAFGYPGTPSTEVLETLAKIGGDSLCCEWSPNEKVALEAAAGASMAGARTLTTMKLVGLNVAADPLMTLSYLGVQGGMVVLVADDPGQHSSQTEQDTRHYARLAKVPILEPADAEEACAVMFRAFEISEKYRCPVIVRTTTCVSHSRCFVEEPEQMERKPVHFEKDVTRWIPIPLWGRKKRIQVEERMKRQADEASSDDTWNKILPGNDRSFGIVSSGVTALYCRERFPDHPMLKLAWSFPFPDELLRRFADSADRIIVIEEGDPILEEHIKSLGIPCSGKDLVPRCGELTPDRIEEVKNRILGKDPVPPADIPEASDLPGRPPVLCAGCPHRALFYQLSRFRDIIVCGDIGCYSLGVFPPLNCTDTMLCMGGGFTVAHGIAKSGESRKTVGIVGDSTFFHSGITGLLDVVYNQGNSLLIVADNRSTAMTGHQDHPGTGVTLQGKTTSAASIETIAKACGMERVYVCDPFDADKMQSILKDELSRMDSPALLISRAPCPLHQKKRGIVRSVDPGLCKGCGACLKCGCPAIGTTDGKHPVIDPAACGGCTLCESICRFSAIRPVG